MSRVMCGLTAARHWGREMAAWHGMCYNYLR